MRKHKKIAVTLISALLMLCMMTIVHSEEIVKEPFAAEFGGPVINYGQITSATLFVIAIIVVALLLLKKTRLAVDPSQGLLEVVHSFSISSKEKLLIIRAGSDYLLLSSSSSGIKKIHMMNKEDINENITENDGKKHDFANIFVNLMSKNRHA